MASATSQHPYDGFRVAATIRAALAIRQQARREGDAFRAGYLDGYTAASRGCPFDDEVGRAAWIRGTAAGRQAARALDLAFL